MFQMTSSALETDLHLLRKIVNHSHALLSGDFPDFCCNCSLEFTNCLRIVLIHIVLQIPPQIKIWGVQVRWMRCPLDVTLPADQPFLKSLSQPVKGVIWCVGGRPVLLEPLVISINPSASSEWCPELPQYCHITFRIHRLSPLIFVFKPIRTDYAMFGNCNPCRALYWV